LYNINQLSYFIFSIDLYLNFIKKYYIGLIFYEINVQKVVQTYKK